jgi:class 3 adenylate cyclase/predicted ATPase
MSSEQQQISATIGALEAQRDLLGNSVVETALAPLRQRLSQLLASDTLTTPPETVQSRKQVTILFLDVVGSTALSRELDPEDVHALMEGALTRCTALVEAHRGRVLKYAGDSLLAVFGADEVREDDPERAVLAGLAMLEEGARQQQLVLKRYGQGGFNVRVGAHTGVVLLGGGLDGVANIRGFSVNVAARMEQTALAGTLRISHDTYHHVRGRFDVVPQPPLPVKGLAAPMLTYLVKACRPSMFHMAGRGIEGTKTCMIGREPELRLLQDAFKGLYSQHQLRVLSVIADAGVGKSRLLYEFESWAAAQTQRFRLLRGRAHPLTRTQPYGLLRDVLARRLHIADSDSMVCARQKIEQGVAPLFAADDGCEAAQAHAHLLGHLIGLDFGDSPHISGIQEDGPQIRERGFHAAAQMLRRLAIQPDQPLLILLDDLHYADDSTLGFLSHLCQVCRDVPLLILSLSRPTPREWPADWPNLFDAQRLVLKPLEPDDSHQLLGELLQRLPNIPASLRELVVSAANGNPFYMEELVKMLIDDGAIVCGAVQWQLHPERLMSLHVPQSLTGVLQARLDSMQASDRLALQQASVIGHVFWDKALAALDAQAPQALASLSKNRLIVVHDDDALGAAFENLHEYAFAHQLLHQVTYDTLLKRTRRQHHAQAARWFANLTSARAKDFLGAAAEHFMKADDNAQASEFFTRAAEHAATRYAHEAVLDYVARGLALDPLVADPISAAHRLRRWRLLDVRERTLDLLGNRTEQLADIEALQALAETLRDDRRRSEVQHRRSSFAMRTGDYPGMQSAARETMRLAERTQDALLSLHGQQRLALALTYLGEDVSAYRLASDGLSEARRLGARAIEALFLNALSVIADSQADQVASLEMDRQDLLINRELGNRRNESIALGNLGNGWLRLGEHTRSHQYLNESLRLSRSVGDRGTESNTLANLSVLALRQGDTPQALAHAQAALTMATQVQSPIFEAMAECSLGNAELAAGQPGRASAAFQRALEIAVQLDNATQHDACAGLARVALAHDDIRDAQRWVEPLLTQLSNADGLEGSESPYLIRLTCQQTLARLNDPRAPSLLHSTHSELLAAAALIDDDALRDGFLHNIPEHHGILQTWATDPRHKA